MKGSIQFKIGKNGKKTYYAVARVKGKPKWFKGGPTKKDAQRVLNDKLSELNRGTYREPTNITFEAFGEKWLRNYAEKNVKPNTYDRYKDIINRLLVPEFGKLKVRDITTDMIQEFITNRLDVVSNKTAINEYSVISIIFQSAKLWEKLYVNPAQGVKKPPLKRCKLNINDILQHCPVTLLHIDRLL